MTKSQKFIAFIQTILADQFKSENLGQIKRKCLILEDSFNVTEKELISEKHLIRDALEFIEWRTLKWNDPFDSAPKWLTKETVSKILIG